VIHVILPARRAGHAGCVPGQSKGKTPLVPGKSDGTFNTTNSFYYQQNFSLFASGRPSHLVVLWGTVKAVIINQAGDFRFRAADGAMGILV